MRQLCGETAVAAIPIVDFAKRFALEPLTRATAIIVDENDVGSFIDKAANLKAVITNDVISIDRKFKTPISYQFYGFMVQCLNELPRVKDKSDSFYRRQLFIPFEKCFTGRERKYIKEDYLHRKEVLEYVLYRVLNMNFYTLSEPQRCKDVLMEYKEFNDPVRQFFEEMEEQFSWDLLPFDFLYDLYKAWFPDLPIQIGKNLLGSVVYRFFRGLRHGSGILLLNGFDPVVVPRQGCGGVGFLVVHGVSSFEFFRGYDRICPVWTTKNQHTKKNGQTYNVSHIRISRYVDCSSYTPTGAAHSGSKESYPKRSRPAELLRQALDLALPGGGQGTELFSVHPMTSHGLFRSVFSVSPGNPARLKELIGYLKRLDDEQLENVTAIVKSLAKK